MLASENFQDFVKSVKEAGESEPQVCEQVDVQGLENFSNEFASNVQDYIVNVDLTKAQFDSSMLFEQANRLGMDFGDLQEYGFETKSSSCEGASSCITKDSFKDLDDVLNKKNMFTNKLFIEATDLYRRA